MNAGKQAVWLSIALMVLAYSGWYFASSAPVIKLDKKTLETTIDTTIQHLTIRQYDAQGELIQSIKTPWVNHIPLHDTHELKQPLIQVTENKTSPWEIHAEYATSVHGGQEITLKKQVIIHQEAGEKTAESTLKTESITYYPKEKIAVTKDHVTYEQAGNVMHSKGMKAYLDQKRVLLSQARGSYVPRQG
jgi:lipopolysaccharide export system protein LptC